MYSDWQDYISLINSQQNLLNNHISDIKHFLQASRTLSDEYNLSGQAYTTEGFNIFKITSDLYYRENYHSDILKAFLDPNERHKERALFLNEFICMLNLAYPDKPQIDKHLYSSAVVEREYGKIDILIRDDVSKHCIIIENKINNAGDMPRQLPRYHNYMYSLGYKVDAIVYIPLAPDKTPDTTDWTVEEKRVVLPKVFIIPAFAKGTTVNLVNNWIIPSQLKTNNIDCHSILRQYGELIKSLNHNIMDSVIISKFYNSLLDGNNRDTALSIQSMLPEVPIIMARRLYDLFKPLAPLCSQIWLGYKPNFCGLVFTVNDIEYKIDTYSDVKEGYKLFLFATSDRHIVIPWADKIKIISRFYKQESGELVTTFGFYEEAEVVRCVEDIIRGANATYKQ